MRKLALLIIVACLFSACSGKKGKLLEFPNTRQAYDFSCGPGAVQVVMAYYGEDFRESELIELLKTEKSEGTYTKDIVKFLHRQGLSAKIIHRMNTEQLFGYIDKGIPVITLIQAWGNESDFLKHYKNTWDDGHFVVVIGYTDKDVLISDPALYTTGYIPIAEFMDRWHDVDEGNTKTYQLGIPVYGRQPKFSHHQVERIK